MYSINYTKQEVSLLILTAITLHTCRHAGTVCSLIMKRSDAM